MTDLATHSPTALPTLEVIVPPSPDRDPRLVYLASLAPSSRAVMTRRLRIVAGFFGVRDDELPWAGLGYAHVVAIRAQLLAQGLAPATIDLTLAAVRGVARESWRLGYISAEQYHRMRDIKGAPGGQRLPTGRSFTLGELQALLTACANDATKAGVRDAAMIAILYSTGLRRAELVALDLSDWIPDAAALQVRHGKGNKQRRVYLSGGAVAALEDWLTVRDPAPGRLFLAINRGNRLVGTGLSAQTVRDILRKRAAAAKVAHLSPHDFRRTVAGDLLDREVDIVTVQQLLGHASVETTARYDRRGERVRQQAVGKLHVPYVRRKEQW